MLLGTNSWPIIHAFVHFLDVAKHFLHHGCSRDNNSFYVNSIRYHFLLKQNTYCTLLAVHWDCRTMISRRRFNSSYCHWTDLNCTPFSSVSLSSLYSTFHRLRAKSLAILYWGVLQQQKNTPLLFHYFKTNSNSIYHGFFSTFINSAKTSGCSCSWPTSNRIAIIQRTWCHKYALPINSI